MKLSYRKIGRSVSFLALATAIGMAPYGGTPLPDQVEEDWQAVVATPDVLGVGPQMTMVMSPNSDPTAAFVTFYLNYRDYPSWKPGGMGWRAKAPWAASANYRGSARVYRGKPHGKPSMSKNDLSG